MNREIKFRIWDTIDKMFEILNVAWTDSIGTSMPSIYNYPNRRVVQQFTGLHDKNDKEIWEGDIVGIGKDHYPRWIIEWNDRIAAFTASGYYLNTNQNFSVDSRALIVIGNIFENPELLK